MARNHRLGVEALEDRSTPATFTLTNLNDSGVGSLRDAIAQANAVPDADTIVIPAALTGSGLNPLAVPLSTVGDTSAGPSAFLISTPVTILGGGRTLAHEAEAPFRFFTIGISGSLTLRDLTLERGRVVGGNAGAGGGGAGMGGAVFNAGGTLEIYGCTLALNSATGGATNGTPATGGTGGGGRDGNADLLGNGGQPNAGAVGGGSGGYGGGGGAGTTTGGAGGFGGGGGAATLAGGTGGVGGFGGGGGGSPNGGTDGTSLFGGGAGFGRFGGGGAGMGGAIFNAGGTVRVANSTLVNNGALGGNATDGVIQDGNGGGGFGGGIFNLNGQVTLTNVTFHQNRASSGAGVAPPTGPFDGGAVYNLSFAATLYPGGPPVTTANPTATVTVANTILANSGTFYGGISSDVANNQIDGTATVNATGPNLVTRAVVNTGGTVAGTPFVVGAQQFVYNNVNMGEGGQPNNGGPTQTLLPLSDSLAVGAGSTAVLTAANFGGTVPAFDQRGERYPRVVGGRVDLGAVQAVPATRLVVSGKTDGTANLLVPNSTTGEYSPGGVTYTPFAGFAGQVRAAAGGDVNGDGVADTVFVTGPGGPIRVAVISGADDASVLVSPFDPFGGDFTGGGFVTVADIDGDGKAEFAVSPDQGGGPRVSIFSYAGGTPSPRANFFGIDDPNFRGGARVALGDVNGDGTPDLAVAAGFLGGPRIALFSGTTLFGTPTRLVPDFFAFPGTDAETLRNGVFVAAGDIDGDGFAELVFGGGPGGAPRVFILNGAKVAAGDVAGAQAAPVGNFFVDGNTTDRGGVHVAVKNADSDTKRELVVGSGEGSPSKFTVYLGTSFVNASTPATSTPTPLDPFGGAIDGVFVG